MNRRLPLCALMLLAMSCAHAPTGPIVPVADYHAHLISPAAAALRSEPPLPTVTLPDELAALLRERAKRWNDASLAELYTADAVVLDPFAPIWLRGRDEAGRWLSGLFDGPYEIHPVSFGMDGSAAHIAGYFFEKGAPFGQVHLSLKKESGAWRIAAETLSFPGPPVRQPVTAEQLVAQLDDAGMKKAVVLSVAYWFASGLRRTPLPDEQAKVRAENDWTAEQASRFPDRLVAFCSVNPQRDYALEEIARCAKNPAIKGLKLHLGNSAVDPRNPDHVAKVREVFRAANEHRLAIVAHLWTNPAYEKEGAVHAKVFLDEYLAAAPDIPVQIAHMAGGGRSTEPALAVFADAIAARDPRTKNVWFDVATLTSGQSQEGLRQDAKRMRQIGLDRILYGTDTVPPNPPARQSWNTFRNAMPLTDAELRIIAGNVAPYLR